MVNMYGAGNAYDRRYIQKNTFMPQHIKTRTPSAPQHTVLCSGNHGGDTTVNYKVQIGPGGFWGGALGFLNGFLNTAPNLFGNKTNWNSAGTINQPQMNPAQDKLGNLKTLFPKFKIVSEGNDQYSASDANGKLVAHNVNYDEMCKILGTLNDTEEKNNKPEQKKKSESEPSVLSKTPTPAPAENTPAPQAPTSEVEPNGVNPKKAGGGGKKIDLTNWYKAYSGGTAEGNNGVKFSNCKSAQQVTNMLLQNKMDYLSNADRAELTKEIIAKNRSVFNTDGTLKEGNNWHKLDIPNVDYIKEQYVAEGITRTDKDGNVTYASNTTGEYSTKRSQNNRDTIAKNLGFNKTEHRDVYKKGNNYYKYIDGKFTQLTSEETRLLNGKTSLRPTNRKGIYYNEKTKQHYVKNGNTYQPLVITEKGKQYNVKQINSNGTWIDTAGKPHTSRISER